MSTMRPTSDCLVLTALARTAPGTQGGSGTETEVTASESVNVYALRRRLYNLLRCNNLGGGGGG